MKKIIIIVLIVALVAGLAVYFYKVTPGMEEVEGVVEVDYPDGDTNPEHLAEVLGSYSRYEELRDSKLRKPNLEMEIGYDTYGAEQRKVAWVFLAMRGEIIKIEGRVITIANNGETISLYVPELAEIYMGRTWGGEEIGFEELKTGDWLPIIYVAINTKQAQARLIHKDW